MKCTESEIRRIKSSITREEHPLLTEAKLDIFDDLEVQILPEKHTHYSALIVDNEQAIIGSWADFLRREKWDVIIAINAHHALEIMEQRHFDVIVSDLILPGMDGLKLLENIRRESPEQEVVIWTRFSTKEKMLKAFRLGASGYLDKSDSIHDFLDILTRLAQRSQLRQQNQRLTQEIQEQNKKLAYQHRIMSELYDLGLDMEHRTASFTSFTTLLCQRLQKIFEAKEVTLLLSYQNDTKFFTATQKQHPLPHHRPESLVLDHQRTYIFNSDELDERYPLSPFPRSLFLGLPLNDPHTFIGALSIYFDNPSHILLLESELISLVAQKIAFLLSNKIAEERLLQSYQEHIHIAEFNRQILSEFRFDELQEIELYQTTFEKILSLSPKDQRPLSALVVRQQENHSLKALPFISNPTQGKIERRPTLTLPPHWNQPLSDPDGVIFDPHSPYNQIELPQSHFPTQLIEYLGPIHNFVSCPLYSWHGTIGNLILFNYSRPIHKADAAILISYSVMLGFQLSIVQEVEERQQAQLLTMTKLAELAEKRDGETGAHLQRISHYSKRLAEKLAEKNSPYHSQIDQRFIKAIFQSSPLHDIGKVSIPDEILLKPGKLTDEEYQEIQKHPLVGAQILEGADFLKIAKDIALGHHEHFDGNGYPHQLKGEEIPLAARIVALADVYDALTSNRKYRQTPFSHDQAREYILQKKGTQFDPVVVDAFLQCEEDFKKMCQNYAEKSLR